MQKDDNADIVAREGDNITLDCDARGHPSPQVVWRREDKEDILVNGRKGNSKKQMIKIHCLEILSKYSDFIQSETQHTFYLFKSLLWKAVG